MGLGNFGMLFGMRTEHSNMKRSEVLEGKGEKRG